MILPSGDKRREKFLKDGSVLRKMRNTGGGAKGCIAGGIVFLVFGVLLGAPCLLAGLPKAAVATGGVFGIPGLLMIIPGILMHKKKMKNYLAYYEKQTGFDREELKLVDQELMEPDMVMFGNVPDENRQGASEKHPHIACMITKHYFVAPMVAGTSYIRRNSDMILAAYSQEIPGIGGYQHGLVFLSKRDEDGHKNGTLTRDVCMEIIEVLKERQPALITGQRFVYEGKQYNVITDVPEILKLFNGQGN